MGWYFSTTAGYSDNQYSFCWSENRNINKGDSKFEDHQLILCKVLVGSSNFGKIALELDQTRTLSQKRLNKRWKNRLK